MLKIIHDCGEMPNDIEIYSIGEDITSGIFSIFKDNKTILREMEYCPFCGLELSDELNSIDVSVDANIDNAYTSNGISMNIEVPLADLLLGSSDIYDAIDNYIREEIMEKINIEWYSDKLYFLD